jgi:hypothetical protein
MRLSQAKKKYRNQYILFKYKDAQQESGQVLCHSSNWSNINRKVMALPKPFKNLHLLFSGPLIPPGFGTLLCLK